MTQELITELREWRIASAPYEPEYKVPPSDLHLKAADALERMVEELETANRIKTEQIDYAIGLQRAIEAHCLEELAPEDVCPHHAEKLNEHFNRQQVLEKEHTEFYSEVVTLRSTVEHLRLRENRLTTECDAIKEQMTADRKQFLDMRNERDSLREGLDGWHSRYLDCEVERDVEKEHVRQCVANIAKLVAERDALRADAMRYRFIFAESDRVDPVCAVVWKKGNVRNSSEWVNSVGGEWLSKELDAAIGEKHD